MAHGVELHKDSYLLLAVVEKLGIQSRELFFKLRETGWITVSLLTTIFYFFFLYCMLITFSHFGHG